MSTASTRPYRAEDLRAGPAKPRLARTDRFPGIRRLVRGHVHRRPSRQARASASTCRSRATST